MFLFVLCSVSLVLSKFMFLGFLAEPGATMQSSVVYKIVCSFIQKLQLCWTLKPFVKKKLSSEELCDHFEKIAVANQNKQQDRIGILFLKKVGARKEDETRFPLILFRQAVKGGNLQQAELVVNCFHLKINQLNSGVSLLNETAIFGSKEMLLHFIAKGATDLEDSRTHNAVIASLLSRSEDNLECLLRCGFSTVSDSGNDALVNATANLHQKAIHLLLDAGAPVSKIEKVFLPSLQQKFTAAGWCQEKEDRKLRKPTKVFRLIFLARNSVRRTLKTEKNMFYTVKQLPLPHVMKEFVLFGEE